MGFSWIEVFAGSTCHESSEQTQAPTLSLVSRATIWLSQSMPDAEYPEGLNARWKREGESKYQATLHWQMISPSNGILYFQRSRQEPGCVATCHASAEPQPMKSRAIADAQSLHRDAAKRTSMGDRWSESPEAKGVSRRAASSTQWQGVMKGPQHTYDSLRMPLAAKEEEEYRL
ncbi:hypothetical protein CISG_03616 [Coccidioides immitis RMSCC 3703]|uniref:Uncharacterized protein n=1 Tax=Coccidioides immitis RMSCC 3703 TaxID=454286 RepID=A0A0J8QM03_COCIT|nr:hypothetical protein CISG_03616 [Coccidioides immitis RMSCC 3703]